MCECAVKGSTGQKTTKKEGAVRLASPTNPSQPQKPPHTKHLGQVSDCGQCLLQGHRRANLPLDAMHQHNMPLLKQMHNRRQKLQHSVHLAIVPSQRLCTKPVPPNNASVCFRRKEVRERRS